jgi:type III secretory pathway component EscV
MDNLNGFVKIHRKLLTWEWYSDINVRVLFFHCLLRANHKKAKWQGIELKAGQFVTSFEHLAKECGLTIQQTRTALNKLKLTHEITNETTCQYSIITVKNWNLYQANNKPNNKQITNNQQTNNNRQEDKEEKKSNTLSLSNSSTRARVGEREREILKSRIKRMKGIRNITAYMCKAIENGDYKELIKEEIRYQQKKKEQMALQKAEQPEQDEQIETQVSADFFERVKRDCLKKGRRCND